MSTDRYNDTDNQPFIKHEFAKAANVPIYLLHPARIKVNITTSVTGTGRALSRTHTCVKGLDLWPHNFLFRSPEVFMH